MAKVCRRTTAKKAAQTFLKYAVVVGGVLSQVEIPDGDLSDKALITVGLSTALSILRAINNVRKRRKAPETAEQPYVDYRNITTVLLVAGLAGLLAGCVTTTAPDGTVTQSLDLQTAWEIWERLDRERVKLEREREQADAAERARIDAELRRLEPELGEAWQDVMDKY